MAREQQLKDCVKGDKCAWTLKTFVWTSTVNFTNDIGSLNRKYRGERMEEGRGNVRTELNFKKLNKMSQNHNGNCKEKTGGNQTRSDE